MNKEQLAQIVLKNYVDLAQAMDQNIQNNDETLLEYYEVLQQQLISEMNKLSNKQESQEIPNESIQEQEILISEPEEEYEEEMITYLAQQLIETGTISTLTPLSENLMNKISEKAKQLEQQKIPRPSFFQNTIEKLKNSGLVKNISFAEKKLLRFLAKKESKHLNQQEEKVEMDENIDKDYIEEMAQLLVRRGELLTLAPIPEKYMILIEKRAKELRNNSEAIKEIDYDSKIISNVNPITPPNKSNVEPTLTSTPPQLNSQNKVKRELTAEEEQYIEQAARLYLQQGYLSTFGPTPPAFATEILQRAKEIKQQELQKSELIEMLNEESITPDIRNNTK